MKIGSVFKGDYLKAVDLSKGERLSLVISEVVIAELDDGEKPVCHFKNIEKGLVLNKTNANMITEIAGTDETDEWEGIKICLYSTKVDFQGKRVDALRVDYPDSNKPPIINVSGNGNGLGKHAPAPVVDNTNWKTEMTLKLKALCTEQKLDWDTKKKELLMTYAGSDNFANITPGQAKQACANLEDPSYIPF